MKAGEQAGRSSYPWSEQKSAALLDSRTRFTAYGGARGGGKSWALRRKLIALCLRYPGIRCLLVRRTYPELKANHVGPMLREYGALLCYSEGEKRLSLSNGSTIDLGYCACDRDLLRYQGQEYDIIAVDGTAERTGAYFRQHRIYREPRRVGHAWVKRLFIDRSFRPGENPDDYSFIPALVYDNDVLLSADPGYVRQLERLPARLRDAWLHGRWDVFEGQFFAEFDESVHVFDAATGVAVIPNNTRRFVALDSARYERCVGVDTSSGLWVFGECCEPGLTLSEAAGRVVELCRGQEVEYAVASPDLWNRRQDSGRSGAEIMQAVPGMPPLRPADSRRIPGWRVLREYLAGRGDGLSLHISRRCTTLINSMQSLLCDPARPEDAAGKPHILTHAPEALRYAVMSRPRPPEPEAAFLPFSFKRGRSLYDL